MHALTLECVMAWFAERLGYGGEKEFWSLVGFCTISTSELYPSSTALWRCSF